MQRFALAVPDAALDDLRRRLDRTRLPDDDDNDDAALGLRRPVLAALVDHWRERYDWRAWEARINHYEQYLADVDGLRLHVLHAPSPHADALPLVLTHGWPGSIVEFLDCIEPLRERFHVVVPSMPGYGFSGPTTRVGVDVHAIAAATVEVMRGLGYPRFVAQGGDWGALVTRRLGEAHADAVMAIHCNMLFAFPAGSERPMDGVTEADAARMARAAERIRHGTGYMALQSTRPQSLAPAHADSPAGLAAWIVEKFQAWSDLDDDDLTSVYTYDQLLTNVMLYWLPNTAGSAARLYAEATRRGNAATSPWTGRVDVPTGHAVYPRELLQTPRAWAEARYRIVHWTEQPRGGHFAAFERPDLFCADLLAFADEILAFVHP